VEFGTLEWFERSNSCRFRQPIGNIILVDSGEMCRCVVKDEGLKLLSCRGTGGGSSGTGELRDELE
jgi:hypothetical protein